MGAGLTDVLDLASARVDLDRRVAVRADGRRERLTSLEVDLLRFLAREPGRVASRDEIHREVWGHAPSVMSRACDTVVRRLRLKIEADPADPEALLTVHGGGYTLVVAAPADSPAPAPVREVLPVPTAPRELRVDGRHIDLVRARIVLPDGTCALTVNELRLLEQLAASPGVPVDRDTLKRRVWGSASGRALDSTLLRLRRKLERDPSDPRILVTTPTGYCLVGLESPPLGLVPSPPPAHLDETRLPGEVDARFGRDDEITEVRRWLDAGARVVTLLGPGGVGKTRLALAVARQLGRARWIDLSAVTTAERMVVEIGAAVGVIPDPRDPDESLGNALRALGPATLVLDNLEQLLPAVAEGIARLVSGAPDARVLATSRVPLGIRGERRVTVGPLPADAAVALFLDRATRALRPEELDDVQQLVEELEGVPLAIELAAARTSVLAVDAIRRHAENRLQLLAVSDPSRPARHRSLRASLDASVALLSGGARWALARLTVFVGTFSLDLAEPLLEGIDGAWPVDLVQELADAHLLRADDDPGRFSMPVVVREYAAELLGPEERRRAELLHGMTCARLGASEVRSDELGRVFDDLLAAAQRAVGRADLRVALPTLAAVVRVLERSRPLGQVLDLADRLTTLAADGASRAEVLLLAARVHMLAGSHARAVTLLEPAVEAAERHGLTRVATNGYALLASVFAFEERLDDARTHAERALRGARELGDPDLESWSLCVLGMVERKRGRYAEARPWLVAARQIAERAGIAGREAEALRELAFLPAPPTERAALGRRAAELARMRGDREQEFDALLPLIVSDQNRFAAGTDRALAAWRDEFVRRGDRLRTLCVDYIGGVWFTAHLDLAAAETALRRVVETSVAIGSVSMHEDASWRLGAVHLLRGELGEARLRLDEGLLVVRRRGVPLLEAAVMHLRAWLAIEEGQTDAGRAAFAEVAAHPDPRCAFSSADARVWLARLDRTAGDRAGAGEHARAALELARESVFPNVELRALCELSRLEPNHAERHLAAAAAVLAPLGDSPWLAIDLGFARADAAAQRGDRAAAVAALDAVDAIAEPRRVFRAARAAARARLERA